MAPIKMVSGAVAATAAAAAGYYDQRPRHAPPDVGSPAAAGASLIDACTSVLT